MLLKNLLSLSALVLATGLLFAGCDDHDCATDADCPEGQMCHIEDGVEPHCMDMGDDDDSAM
jgi:Cys-rich repeat protein